MKANCLLIIVTIFFISCKSDSKVETSTEEKAPTSIPEKVAYAHGYQNWKKVEKIAFTFNVDRDSSHFERSWVWHPKSNDVLHISGADTLQYNRMKMDSIALKTNSGFINDRYWLLAPFNLMWDQNNYSFEHQQAEVAPISGKTMQKLTIVYGNEGGYTPGDAYDFYFGEDYLIQEWVFRKTNQEEPSMATTWEGYAEYEGLTLVKDHKKAEENFNLYIDGIVVEMNNN